MIPSHLPFNPTQIFPLYLGYWTILKRRKGYKIRVCVCIFCITLSNTESKPLIFSQNSPVSQITKENLNHAPLEERRKLNENFRSFRTEKSACVRYKSTGLGLGQYVFAHVSGVSELFLLLFFFLGCSIRPFRSLSRSFGFQPFWRSHNPLLSPKSLWKAGMPSVQVDFNIYFSMKECKNISVNFRWVILEHGFYFTVNNPVPYKKWRWKDSRSLQKTARCFNNGLNLKLPLQVDNDPLLSE